MEHTLDICLYSHRVWTLSLSCPQSPSIAGQTSCQRHRPGSWTTQLIGQGHATGCILCQRRLCKWTQNASWFCRWNLYPTGSSAVLCFTKSLEECLVLIALRPRNSQTFRQFFSLRIAKLWFMNERNTLCLFYFLIKYHIFENGNSSITGRHNLRSFLAAYSTQSYFLMACTLSCWWHLRQKCRI